MTNEITVTTPKFAIPRNVPKFDSVEEAETYVWNNFVPGEPEELRRIARGPMRKNARARLEFTLWFRTVANACLDPKDWKAPVEVDCWNLNGKKQIWAQTAIRWFHGSKAEILIVLGRGTVIRSNYEG